MNLAHVITMSLLLAMTIAAATTLAIVGSISGDAAFSLCRDIALTVIGGGAVAVGGNISSGSGGSKPPSA